MHIILVGGGNLGKNLSARLDNLGHEIVVVEKEKETADELASNSDFTVVYGDGTDIEILKDADAESADALAAITDSDETNLMVCKIAEDLGISRIVTRVNKSENVRMFEDVGADTVINSVSATTGLFEKALTGPSLYGILSLGSGNVEVTEVRVSGNSKSIGKPIKDLKLPELCTIAIITRNDEIIPARGDTKLLEGDRVILAGKSEDIQSVSKDLGGN